MSDDKDSELRLIEKLGISLKNHSCDALPSEHRETFNLIREIGEKTFDDYGKDITFRNNEPWRKQTHDRAKWLAGRAASLVNQQRNEAGWRFSLEPDVFHRFKVEVACPTCGARIWKSDFEAYNSLPYAEACTLRAHRSKRETCNCPYEHRPRDSHLDVGQNLIFDDRAEELIIHGPLVDTHLPKKKPDRIFGLKKTKAFAEILDVKKGYNNEASRCSPFKENTDPLLFPFLIIEAKPERRSAGFKEIQIQTALPIWELLKLQESIRVEVPGESHSGSPLIWFFANRGDSWRVYGCYVTQEPKQYEIMQLWDGCITEKDASLRLLLIVDYIADWARDIYRPSILKHLKSTVSKIPYDQVGLINDSDVQSLQGTHHLRRQISNWFPASPTIMDANEEPEGILSDPGPILHKNILPISIPNTELGSLRSASLFESRIFGLRLTEHNVEYLLRFSKGFIGDTRASASIAGDILNLFSEKSDYIAMPEADLDFLEDSWTGDMDPEVRVSASSNLTTFYVSVEFCTFMTNAWNIAKEISYIAVSKPALDALIIAAKFLKPPPGLYSIEQRARPCPHGVWRDTIGCLRLGSPWQHFSAAISCTRLSISSLPVPKRADYIPDTESLGFTLTSQTPMRGIIERCHNYNKEPIPPQMLSEIRSLLKVDPNPRQLSFIRDSERMQVTSLRQDHDIQTCERCRKLRNKSGDHRFSSIDAPAIPKCGMVLVATLDLTTSSLTKHDICLFAFDIAPNIAGNSDLAVEVDDLLKKDKIFHTIRHPLPPRYVKGLCDRDTIWNLPLPFRPVTKKQRHDVRNWSLELREKPPMLKSTGRQMDYWDNLQLLLYFLSDGLTYEGARAGVEALVKKSCRRRTFYGSLDVNYSRQNQVAGG